MRKIDTITGYILIDENKVEDPKLGNEPITGDRYYSKEFMDKEWEGIWTKTWLIAGLSAQIPNTGDRFTFDIGRENILFTRDKEGKVHAFYNVCQHRGNRLVHEEISSGKFMACNYHGWRFSNEGDLIFVPSPEDFEGGTPCGKLKLVEILCREWAGFLWFSMDENVEPLEDFLGPIKSQIETYQVENMIRTHWVTIEGDFNWKVVQDNFCESYHLPFVHPQSRYFIEMSYRHCQFDMYDKEGHTRMFMPGARPTMGLKGDFEKTKIQVKEEHEFWGLDSETFREDPHSMREAMQKVKREKGAEKGFDYSRFTDDQLTDHYHYTLFPNASLSLKPDGCIFLMAYPHPNDPEQCLFHMWYLTWYPEGQDEYYSHALKKTLPRDFKPPHEIGPYPQVSAGLAIDQDLDIWSTHQLGLRSRGYKKAHMPQQENRVRFFHERVDKYIDKLNKL